MIFGSAMTLSIKGSRSFSALLHFRYLKERGIDVATKQLFRLSQPFQEILKGHFPDDHQIDVALLVLRTGGK